MNYLTPINELTAIWLESLTPTQRHMIVAGVNLNPSDEWIQFKKLLNMGPACE